jgi:hypothetical protein
MWFVVKTQILENYGCHEDIRSGKFEDGQHYWKMKGSTDIIVKGLDRAQDAFAFVASKFICNNIEWKEFPVEVMTYNEWEDRLNNLNDEEYAKFLRDQAFAVSPDGEKGEF